MEEQVITKTQIEHLETLLQFTSANELRKSVQRTLFAYLLEQDSNKIDMNFKETIENHFFLIDFFDKLNSKR
ncbi:hypothetical protein D3C87_39380 [compost metagenome]